MNVKLWYNIPSIICYKLQYQIINHTVWLSTFCHLLCAKTVYFGPDSKLITLFLHVSKGFCISPSIIMNHYGPNRKLWTSSKVHLQKCSVFFTSHNFYFTFSDWILNYTHTSPARSLWHSSLIFFLYNMMCFPLPCSGESRPVCWGVAMCFFFYFGAVLLSRQTLKRNPISN